MENFNKNSKEHNNFSDFSLFTDSMKTDFIIYPTHQKYPGVGIDKNLKEQIIDCSSNQLVYFFWTHQLFPLLSNGESVMSQGEIEDLYRTAAEYWYFGDVKLYNFEVLLNHLSFLASLYGVYFIEYLSAELIENEESEISEEEFAENYYYRLSKSIFVAADFAAKNNLLPKKHCVIDELYGHKTVKHDKDLIDTHSFVYGDLLNNESAWERKNTDVSPSFKEVEAKLNLSFSRIVLKVITD